MTKKAMISARLVVPTSCMLPLCVLQQLITYDAGNWPFGSRAWRYSHQRVVEEVFSELRLYRDSHKFASVPMSPKAIQHRRILGGQAPIGGPRTPDDRVSRLQRSWTIRARWRLPLPNHALLHRATRIICCSFRPGPGAQAESLYLPSPELRLGDALHAVRWLVAPEQPNGPSYPIARDLLLR
jgi:hypothetical protein